MISPVAAAGDLTICTSTDGNVRALALTDGQQKWFYDAKTPFFAGPAVAGTIVYAADLKGVVHAIDLAGGKELWRLDLATDPAVKAKIKEIFLNMHKDAEGKAILDGIMVDKFIVPKDGDYNSVREMDAWLKKNIK